jgi:acyl dehydratase
MPEAAQRYFEDVEPGDEFEEPWHPTRDLVIAYLSVGNPDAGTRADRFTDDEAARKIGMPRAIVPGALSLCMATRLVTDWMGTQGTLRSIDVDYRRAALHEDSLRVLGLVTDTDDNEGVPLIKLDVYIENDRGERPLQGVAIVELPRRPA